MCQIIWPTVLLHAFKLQVHNQCKTYTLVVDFINIGMRCTDTCRRNQLPTSANLNIMSFLINVQSGNTHFFARRKELFRIWLILKIAQIINKQTSTEYWWVAATKYLMHKCLCNNLQNVIIFLLSTSFQCFEEVNR